MTRVVLCTLIVMTPWYAECDDTPVKATVRELLTHQQQYDGRRVDVTGYYRCDNTHASDLWPDAATGKQHLDGEPRLYIDPAAFTPNSLRKTWDPWRVTEHRARVVGTFRIRLVAVGVASTGGSGPSITDVSYFRRVR